MDSRFSRKRDDEAVRPLLRRDARTERIREGGENFAGKVVVGFQFDRRRFGADVADLYGEIGHQLPERDFAGSC